MGTHASRRCKSYALPSVIESRKGGGDSTTTSAFKQSYQYNAVSMIVSATKKPTGLYYKASINQRGVKVSITTKSRKESITRCLHEYMCTLKS